MHILIFEKNVQSNFFLFIKHDLIISDAHFFVKLSCLKHQNANRLQKVEVNQFAFSEKRKAKMFYYLLNLKFNYLM